MSDLTVVLLVCDKCKRKILIKHWTNGPDSTTLQTATCWSCMGEGVRKQMREEHGIED
jgi:hypothetical protein